MNDTNTPTIIDLTAKIRLTPFRLSDFVGGRLSIEGLRNEGFRHNELVEIRQALKAAGIPIRENVHLTLDEICNGKMYGKIKYRDLIAHYRNPATRCDLNWPPDVTAEVAEMLKIVELQENDELREHQKRTH